MCTTKCNEKQRKINSAGRSKQEKDWGEERNQTRAAAVWAEGRAASASWWGCIHRGGIQGGVEDKEEEESEGRT